IDPPLLKVEDLFAIRRELGIGLWTRCRGKLPRDRRLPGEFVERIEIEILLSCRGSNQEKPFPVTADRLKVRVDSCGDDAQPLADLFEYDLHMLWRGLPAFGHA